VRTKINSIVDVSNVLVRYKWL